jgi:hypothetical protein
MKHLSRVLLVAVAVAAFTVTATPTRAAGVSPAQLSQAGWTCIQPGRFPMLLLCFNPGVGLPPLPGTPGFADRLPSYQNLVFDHDTGAFLGTQNALRPDIYEQGKPPCPQQPGGEYIYNAFNDLWFCNRAR